MATLLATTLAAFAPQGSASTPVAHPLVVVTHSHLALENKGVIQAYHFAGVNAYQLTSEWGTNWGCGWGEWSPATLDSFFASLAPNAIVRTWFFQQFATSIGPSGSVRNWFALDQMLQEADKYNVHLDLVLGNEDGTCDDGHWKDTAWYAGGYRQEYNEGFVIGNTPVDTTTTSYAQWVHDAVSRYKGNPAIAMWEPVNEPEDPSCSATPGPSCWGHLNCANEAAATTAMRSFFDTIGTEIQSLDPGKLVSDGALGGGSCGEATDADFRSVIASPGINVVGYHDYSGGAVTVPGDLVQRIADASALGKPTIISESGVTGCANATVRGQEYSTKMSASFADGVSAYLPWWYSGDGGQPTCNSPIDVDSPTWQVIHAGGGPAGPAVNIAKTVIKKPKSVSPKPKSVKAKPVKSSTLTVAPTRLVARSSLPRHFRLLLDPLVDRQQFNAWVPRS